MGHVSSPSQPKVRLNSSRPSYTKRNHRKNTARGGGYYTKNGYTPSDIVRTKQDRNKQFLMALKFQQLTEVLQSGSLSKMINFMEHCTDQRYRTIEEWHPAYLSSQANAADNPTWEQAMNGPNKEGYWEYQH